MKRSSIVPLLVAIPLVIAGCGGSGATPKTAAGVRQDLTRFTTLIDSGQSQKACDRYLDPTATAQLDALGGCAKVIEYAMAESGPSTVSKETAGFTASVRGNTATYRTNTDSGTAVYVLDHWVFGAPNVTQPATGTGLLNQPGNAGDAAAKELAHTMQVAVESYATDNNGSYAGLTASILNQYESTIQIGSGNDDAYADPGNWGSATATGYTVTATAPTTQDTFSITRSSSGALSRSCTTVAATPTGCAATTGKTAAW